MSRAKIKNCLWCGKKLGPGQMRTCSIEHRDLLAGTWKQQKSEMLKEGKREKMEVYKPRKRKVLITDAAQHKLNLDIDRKNNIKCEFRHLKPGDPEFDRVASLITPLHLIPKTERTINVFGEIDPSSIPVTRRNENINHMRG